MIFLTFCKKFFVDRRYAAVSIKKNIVTAAYLRE